MQLTEREREKMIISLAGMIAQNRKDKGIKLNHPESVALITSFVLEGARAGKTVSELMDEGRQVLTRRCHGRCTRNDPNDPSGSNFH